MHDEEWCENDDGEGWYIHPADAPTWTAGIDAPYNWAHAMGSALAELYRATDDTRYRNRVVKLARTASTRLCANGTRRCS